LGAFFNFLPASTSAQNEFPISRAVPFQRANGETLQTVPQRDQRCDLWSFRERIDRVTRCAEVETWRIYSFHFRISTTTKTRLFPGPDTRHQLPRQGLTSSLIKKLHVPAAVSFNPAGQVTIQTETPVAISREKKGGRATAITPLEIHSTSRIPYSSHRLTATTWLRRPGPGPDLQQSIKSRSTLFRFYPALPPREQSTCGPRLVSHPPLL